MPEAVKWRITLGMLAGVITRDEIRSTYDTIRPCIRRTPVVQVDLSELDPSGPGPADRHAQAGAAAVRRVVQGPRRVREPAAAGRAARRSGGGLRRQPRRGRGLCRAPPRRAGQDLRAHRVRPGQDGAHPPARRGACGDRRALRRRAGRRAGLGGEFGRDERARLRPARDPARPGHPGPRAGRADGRAWTPCWCRSAAAG